MYNGVFPMVMKGPSRPKDINSTAGDGSLSRWTVIVTPPNTLKNQPNLQDVRDDFASEGIDHVEEIKDVPFQLLLLAISVVISKLRRNERDGQDFVLSEEAARFYQNKVDGWNLWIQKFRGYIEPVCSLLGKSPAKAIRMAAQICIVRKATEFIIASGIHLQTAKLQDLSRYRVPEARKKAMLQEFYDLLCAKVPEADDYEVILADAQVAVSFIELSNE